MRAKLQLTFFTALTGIALLLGGCMGTSPVLYGNGQGYEHHPSTGDSTPGGDTRPPGGPDGAAGSPPLGPKLGGLTCDSRPGSSPTVKVIVGGDGVAHVTLQATPNAPVEAYSEPVRLENGPTQTLVIGESLTLVITKGQESASSESHLTLTRDGAKTELPVDCL